jgi:hypothetical protein
MNKSVEELLEDQQKKYSRDVVRETSKDEIFTLINALEFSEKNYEPNHEGVEKYVRSNHASSGGYSEANLVEIFQNIREEVIKNRLLNYGHADMLTKSLLEYQRNGTPRTEQTNEQLKEILQAIF